MTIHWSLMKSLINLQESRITRIFLYLWR